MGHGQNGGNMKIYFIMGMLSLCLVSCEGEELHTVGNAGNLEDLPWLQNMMAPYTSPFAETAPPATEVYRYTYQNQNYFLVNLCMGCPDGTYTVYTCKGEIF
jgi:hypothetical protein